MAMEVIDYIMATNAFRPQSFSLRPEDSTMLSRPMMGGPIRTLETPGQWLVATINYAQQTTAERLDVRGFWAIAGLKKNRVRLFDLARPEPAGTYRGAVQVTTNVSAGTYRVPVQSMPGTLRRGDTIGLDDGLHLVTENVLEGATSIPVVPHVRRTIPAGSLVLWDQPTALFICLSPPDAPFSGGGVHEPFSVQLVEVGA